MCHTYSNIDCLEESQDGGRGSYGRTYASPSCLDCASPCHSPSFSFRSVRLGLCISVSQSQPQFPVPAAWTVSLRVTSLPQFPVRAAWIVSLRVTVTASVSGPCCLDCESPCYVTASVSGPCCLDCAFPCHRHCLSFRSMLLGLRVSVLQFKASVSVLLPPISATVG